ncbi:MAG: hypothetical protein WEA09_02330 [Gemmatimonadota bacterium]
MNPRELESRLERARSETFVIAQTDDGFRIHSPTSGGGPHVVDSAIRSCTCKDFERHRHDPEWVCKHMLVIRDRYRSAPPHDAYEETERTAIREEANAPEALRQLSHASPTMLVKRSVSPDGRIDSLSVEFSCPIGDFTDAPRERARQILAAQGGIIRAFLDREQDAREQAPQPLQPAPQRRAPEPYTPAPPEEATGAMPAQLLKIGGTDGNWGRRLFITVQADGRALRLYGSATQLAEHLETAGYPSHAGNVQEGVRLNLPCRIVTATSDDGFVSIEQVLPPRRGAPRHQPTY